jgi:uncharacterized protein YjbI with pentapeptide repeats
LATVESRLPASDETGRSNKRNRRFAGRRTAALASSVMEGGTTTIVWAEDEFEQVLERVRTEGTIDAESVRISAERLERILHSAPEDPRRPGCRQLRSAKFSGATFEHRADFSRATFSGNADFSGTTFEGDASFVDATFTGDTHFTDAGFTGRAVFDKATFNGYAHFVEATFAGGSTYFEATFTGDTYFNRAAFNGNNYFGVATFNGSTFFGEATFEDAALFPGATFESDVRFGEATFKGEAQFGEATFKRAAEFGEATFEREAWFQGAEFIGRASFPRAKFGREARFAGDRAVTFREWADFEGARFAGGAWFGGASFKDRARFRGAGFTGLTRFEGATFERARTFGPLDVQGKLELNRASFRAPVRLLISAKKLSCIGATFEGPANLQVRCAEIDLDESVFYRASTLAPLPLRQGEPACHAVKPGSDEAAEKQASGERPAMPRLASLRGADVANLTLADIDLERCVFESALNLDQLRLATRCPFAKAPSGRFRSRRSIPFVWRWTKRMTICEEGTWRIRPWDESSARGKAWRQDWADVSTHSGTEDIAEPSAKEIDARRQSEADRIAKIYRALRKGREDESNAPGAADFYYGEMEMRRHGGDASRWEHAVISLYWFVSGYGLRASRALIALALTVVVFAFLFHWWGFRPDQGLGRGLLFSVESTSSLFRVPETKNFALTAGGEVLQVILRLAGPLFFGLALLSLRGRVKR